MIFLRVRQLFFLLLLVVMPQLSAASLKTFNQKFSHQVAQEFRKYSIPGGAYVIVKNDHIVALNTFGFTDSKKTNAINSDTVFRLASVSKPFAATITAMLAEENRLNLSDPITKFIPQFVLATPGAADKIQLKHLLSHSSGLMPNAYDNLLHENWSMQKIISRFDRVSPICQPEQCYGYQNIAYGFLQPAIEASQTKSYRELLAERIFEPLDMQHASIGLDAFEQETNSAKPHVLINRISTGKKDRNGKNIKQYVWRTVPVTQDFYKVETAAGVNASISDLAKWLIANMGYKPSVLSPSLLSELTLPRIKTRKDMGRKYWKQHLTDAHYGYGWRIYEFEQHPVIYHSGWVEGYRADIGYSPELDIGFAMLINAESNVINKISSQFWTTVHQQYSPELSSSLRASD